MNNTQRSEKFGQCEYHGWFPTEDDAIYIRCERLGILHFETDRYGHKQCRYLCDEHGDQFKWVKENDKSIFSN